MASIPVEIRGTLYDLQTKSARQVFLAGEAYRSDVGVGGGPIIPPSGGGGTPSHPIALPGDPWWGGDLHPAHPIELPKPPTEPPVDTVPGGDKPAPATGGWGYVAQWSDGSPGGWGLFPGAGAATPKG